MTPDDYAKLIGEFNPETDRILDPKAHAGRLPPEAEPLKKLLNSEAIQVVVKRYKDADDRAQAASDKYKLLGRYSILFTTLAVLFGGFYLLMGALLPTPNEDNKSFWEIVLGGWNIVLWIVFIIQIAFFATAAYFVYFVRDGRILEEWLDTRAMAELNRILLFKTIFGIGEKKAYLDQDEDTIEQPLSSLAFEYFRRYQLDFQIEYYGRRQGDHRKKADDWTLTVACAGLLFVFLLGLTELTGGIELYLYAFAMLTVPIMYQAQETWKLYMGHRRLAFRYRRTLERLEQMRLHLPKAREQIHGKNNAEALKMYVNDVHDIISHEHLQWQQDPGPSRVANFIDTQFD